MRSVQVVRVSDLRPGRREYIQKLYPLLETTALADDIFVDPHIDAIVIATPPSTHFSLAKRALLEGKHVLIEKPLATNSADGQQIVELASQLGKSVAVGHLFLYAPAVTAIRSLVKSQELGRTYYLSSSRCNLGPPNAQTDVLWDLAPHDISIALDLMGEPPETIEAQGGWFTSSVIPETAFLTLRFSGGRMAHIHVSWLMPNKIRRLQLVCSNGVVSYDDMQLSQKVQVFGVGADNRAGARDDDSIQLGYGAGNSWFLDLQNYEPLRAECEDFIRSIGDGTPPYSNGARALEVVRVLERASQILSSSASLSQVPVGDSVWKAT